MNFDGIPSELKAYPQWVLWRYEERQAGKLTKVPFDPKSGFLAAVDNPLSWSDYETAKNVYETSKTFDGLGFVLTERDPFCFIDLDETDDPELLERQIKVYHAFDTYAERSPSGKGAHVLCKGHVAGGRRRGSIEIYSSLRYMTVTGDALNNKPINERQNFAALLWAEMGKDAQGNNVHIDEPQKDDDNTVINRAMKAANGDKFTALLKGEWQHIYPSQSEADFAFIDIVAYYTQNRAQIKRIFLHSGLGQRDKAKRVDYVENMIGRSFDRMLPPIDFGALQRSIAEAFGPKENDPPPGNSGAGLSGGVPAAGKEQTGPQTTDEPLNDSSPNVNPYSLPPGLMGQIADFIYKSSARPVPEIALAAAIGLMAGICGRAYNTPTNAGLNLYTLLVAKSGRGKEAMQSGISKLTNRVAHLTPTARGAQAAPSILEFIGPGEIRSDASLIKTLANKPCCVSILGEFGLQLQAMTSVHANSHLIGLRRVLLDLYGKSGKDQVLGEMVYSDKDKNTNSLYSPAFSILAETTPETFYQGISENLIVQGLLPRFMTIEYYGERQALNQYAGSIEPSNELLTSLVSLVANVHDKMRAGVTMQVPFDQLAHNMQHAFDELCTRRINETERQATAELWNRAHLKALKLACLVAVGMNPFHPVVTADVWRWAEGVVNFDVSNIVGKFERGETGEVSVETEQDETIIDLTLEFLTKPFSWLNQYMPIKQAQEMHALHIIPQTYFTLRCQNRGAFRQDKNGWRRAMYNCLRGWCDRGVFIELPADKVRGTDGTNPFHGHGKVYVIQDSTVFLRTYNQGHRKRGKV